ncbi:MAG TPA: 2-phospho-L-lactate guanylyltransferase [Oceanobacillus sp.]|nr:2-phospho-L-lactate guanylyltransferase [Oceanobacillus sp.]
MSVWAIIPVKPLARAKSRLSAVLSPEERLQLAENLLRHVITTVRSVPEIAGALVISRDTKALSIARDAGAHTVQESGTPELNNALMRATSVVRGWRSGAVLILPADLPLVNADDVRGMLELGLEENTVVIATDEQQDGTNAMLIRPPGLIPYAYGVGSYHRHVSLAREVGALVRVYNSPRLALDIDVPGDLEMYYQLSRNGHHLLTPNGAKG